MSLVTALEELDVLWQHYHGDKSESVRHVLMLRYMHIVHAQARRIARKMPRSIELEDLVQSGTLGLREAIAAFDPARGIKFETYCVARVRGAIFDNLHTLSWVPRTVRRNVALVQQAREQLRRQLGRDPAEDELAAQLQVPPTGYHRFIRQSTRIRFSSLTPAATAHHAAAVSPETLRDWSATDPADTLQRQDLRHLLLRTLSRAERLVLILYYAEQMTMREIGATLGVSESRVSQMHSDLLVRLRTRWQRRVLAASGNRGISLDL